MVARRISATAPPQTVVVAGVPVAVGVHDPVAPPPAAALHRGPGRAVDATVPRRRRLAAGHAAAVRGEPVPRVPDRQGRRPRAHDPAPVHGGPARQQRRSRLPETAGAPRPGGGVAQAGAPPRGRHGRQRVHGGHGGIKRRR